MRIPELDYEIVTPDTFNAEHLWWFAHLGGGEPHSAVQNGTKALMLAVFEDGIRAYLGSAPTACAEAERWVENRERRWAFSFTVICETLGLEPSAVRKRLRCLRAREVPHNAIRRSRPHAGRRTRQRRLRLPRRHRAASRS